MVRNTLKNLFVIRKNRGNWVFEKLANRAGATTPFLLRTVLASIFVSIYISLCFSHCSVSPSFLSSPGSCATSFSSSSVILLAIRAQRKSLRFFCWNISQASSSCTSTLSFSASYLLDIFCISMQASLIANYCLLYHLVVSVLHCAYFVYKFPSYCEVHLMSQVGFDTP